MVESQGKSEKPIPRKVRQKLERWSILCYQNCVRLHSDSVILYKNRRYPTAHALSVIALEELGKYNLLAHGLFYNFFHDEESAKLILDELYNHKAKQRVVMNQDFHHLYWLDQKRLNADEKRELDNIHKTYGYNNDKWLKYFPRVARMEKRIASLETEKQDSLYVGFPKKGKKIDLSSKIHTPLRVSRKKAERQITFLSDYLLLEAVGVLKGTGGLDFEELEAGMTHGYVNFLRKLWPKMTRANRRRYNDLIRLSDADDD
jgi:AbiV family abortive infection protein